MESNYPTPCPDDHFNWNGCEAAVWMVDASKIYSLERKAAKKVLASGNKDDVSLDSENEPSFTHIALEKWLRETFPDIEAGVRWNPFLGLLCDKHIGSMREYANKITGYSEYKGEEDNKDGE